MGPATHHVNVIVGEITDQVGHVGDILTAASASTTSGCPARKGRQERSEASTALRADDSPSWLLFVLGVLVDVFFVRRGVTGTNNVACDVTLVVRYALPGSH